MSKKTKIFKIVSIRAEGKLPFRFLFATVKWGEKQFQMIYRSPRGSSDMDGTSMPAGREQWSVQDTSIPMDELDQLSDLMLKDGTAKAAAAKFRAEKRG